MMEAEHVIEWPFSDCSKTILKEMTIYFIAESTVGPFKKVLVKFYG